MFPYSAIAASQLLRNQKPYVAKEPKISTLVDYTKTSPEDFYKLLTIRAKSAGICEMADMISNWMDFDNLSDKKKRRFVIETETPEYYSIQNRFKRFFNLK
jgi:hypothetical protein